MLSQFWLSYFFGDIAKDFYHHNQRSLVFSMYRSPYASQAKEFIKAINKSFLEAFQLEPRFTYDDVMPGEKLGIISFVDDDVINQRTLNTTQRKVANFIVLIVIGCEHKIEADAEAFAWVQEIDNAIAEIKQIIEAPKFVTDVKIGSKITCVPRQSIKKPHPWMVDISFEVQAQYVIYRDVNGKHTLPQE